LKVGFFFFLSLLFSVARNRFMRAKQCRHIAYYPNNSFLCPRTLTDSISSLIIVVL
jgi:hypothetical protein